MNEIEAGLKGKTETTVQVGDLASAYGNKDARVLSTPRVIHLMEEAALNALEGRLPDGMMTVGTSITMQHSAATPPGVRVWAEATLREVDGRRLVFDVVVYDELEQVSEGVNERFVVPVGKFLEKVGVKAEKLRTKG